MNTDNKIELISQSEYARRIGVGRSYISGLIKREVIQLHDGKINPEEADRARAEIRHASYDDNRHSLFPSLNPKEETPHVIDTTTQHDMAPKSSTTNEPESPLSANGPAPDNQFQDLLSGKQTLSDVKHVDIRKLLDYNRAVREKLEAEEKAGRLLDVDKQRDIAFQTYRTVRDGLLNIPGRIAAAVAARIHELLEEQLPGASKGLTTRLAQVLGPMPPEREGKITQAVTDTFEDTLNAWLQGGIWKDAIAPVLEKEVHSVLEGIVDAAVYPGKS